MNKLVKNPFMKDWSKMAIEVLEHLEQEMGTDFDGLILSDAFILFKTTYDHKLKKYIYTRKIIKKFNRLIDKIKSLQ